VCGQSLYQIRREPQKVEEFNNLVLPLLAEHGSAVGLANATMLRGWAQVLRGQPKEGIGSVQEGLASWRATGSKFQATYRLARAGEAHLFAGLNRHWTTAGWRGGLIRPVITGSCPKCIELGANCNLLSGRNSDVEECFGRALKAAQGQSARLLELRAAMSMARLWRDQGKRRQARELLAPVYGWFTEGFDTP